jgi:uncharacterized protein GlcG (DUF336 family)
MMTRKLAAAVCSALGLAPAAASAQVLMQPNVSLAMANTIALEAIRACKAAGTDVSVAVVDRSGQVRTLMRNDSANPHNAELARRKAYTALTFRMTSLQFRNRTAEGEFAGQRALADAIALGGGAPITLGGDVIGGVGASGSPQQEQDEVCALAGIEAVKAQLVAPK